MAGAVAEAAAVDQRLRMLDAHADGERLGLDRDAALVQHLERVARAVADRQHDMIRRQCACHRRAPRRAPAGCRSRPRCRDRPPGSEAILAAERLDRGAQAFDHRHQPERADMRLGDVEDFLRRAGLDEFGQHLAAEMVRVLDLAVQLAVGERAGAAFAELHVGFRIEHRLAPEAPGVLGALAHHLAALQDDRTEPHLRQHQGGEQAARPGADHHRPRARRAGARATKR